MTSNLNKRILYIQYTNPAGYPPLEHSSRILANDGWQVLFLGTGAQGANNLQFPEHPQITVLQIPFCEAGWRQKLHYLRYCLWVLMWVMRWRPQWIYASDILVCPIAYFLTLIPNTQVIYHEHDSPNSIVDNVFMSWCLKARVLLSDKAKFCILPNQERIDKFISETKTRQPVFCVWNCPSKENIVQKINLSDQDQIRLWYHGSIVPPQLPISVIHALTKLPENVHLIIAGYETIGHKNYTKDLEKEAIEGEVCERYKYIGSLPKRLDLLEKCAKSSIGLCLFSSPTREPMTGASNKPFDYLACGLSLIVPNLPDWKKMYVETGYGLACDPENVDSIVNAVQWFIDHPEEMRTMGERGRQKILDAWNYENQFESVKKQINSSSSR